MNKKVVILISTAALALFFFFTNCSQPKARFDIFQNKNTSTVGNPLVVATYKISQAACQKIVSCNTGLTQDSCLLGLSNSSGFAAPLGLNSSYDTLISIGDAEAAGSITRNDSNTDRCAAQITSLSCNAPEVQQAYQSGQSAPFQLASSIVPTTSCQQAFTPGIKLEVPIELSDRGLSSKTTSTVFNRTRTHLNSDDYDGKSDFYFEVIASNIDSASKTVSLVDSGGAIVADINIPAGTIDPTRLSQIFTPAIGAQDYRVQLPNTTNNDQLQVFTARVRIKQIDATKTKIYIPLMGGYAGEATSDDTATSAPEKINSLSYAQNNTHYLSSWRKNSAALSQLDGATPWTLEVVASAGASTGSGVFIALANASTDSVVTESEISVSSTAPTLLTKNFSNTATQFTDSNLMEIRHRRNVAGGDGFIYKAGLWAKLSNLSHAEIHYRISNLIWQNTSTAKAYPWGLLRPDLSAFSRSTSLYHEAAGFVQNVGTPCSSQLLDIGASDSGNTGSVVSGSLLSFTATTKSVQRSPVLSLVDSHGYIPEVADNPLMSTCVISQSFIVIGF